MVDCSPINETDGAPPNFFTMDVGGTGDPRSTDWEYYEGELELKVLINRMHHPEAYPVYGCILSEPWVQFYKEVDCDDSSGYHYICQCELEGKLTLHVARDRWLIEMWGVHEVQLAMGCEGFDKVIQEICTINQERSLELIETDEHSLAAEDLDHEDFIQADTAHVDCKQESPSQEDCKEEGPKQGFIQNASQSLEQDCSQDEPKQGNPNQKEINQDPIQDPDRDLKQDPKHVDPNQEVYKQEEPCQEEPREIHNQDPNQDPNQDFKQEDLKKNCIQEDLRQDPKQEDLEQESPKQHPKQHPKQYEPARAGTSLTWALSLGVSYTQLSVYAEGFWAFLGIVLFQQTTLTNENKHDVDALILVLLRSSAFMLRLFELPQAYLWFSKNKAVSFELAPLEFIIPLEGAIQRKRLIGGDESTLESLLPSAID
ncbi:uncharacterized protein BO97DRAFT_420912 [Aspergillus homomorphus CBS 101889]|uniref:Uncharacterized protein n=1 Tax=Aspergillus homomorphus (strain CBS 101889) TaxID=1450537 RepID=A0A395I8L4_ASPHC|nr:hypothetical protein BO97DRAFT_420912 [Aspergillus homomorphus CBS 101889]RAL16610.1 hypothetical protein BO97DRAFT_420912 [Aspergillus homomorphus CBS 101889]